MLFIQRDMINLLVSIGALDAIVKWRGMKIYGDARNVVMSYMTRMLNYAVPQLRKRAIPMMLSQKKSGWTPIIERIRIYHKMNVTMKVFD